MGATLYHLLTGTYADKFRQGAVVERAMRKDPAQRFHTADEMRVALLAAIA